MNVLLAMVVLITSACSTNPKHQSVNNEPLIETVLGGDADEHGCRGSAGNKWCARLNKCVQASELVQKADFVAHPEETTMFSKQDFDNYCNIASVK